MDVSNKRVLIFGDSLTHPGADSDPEQSMVSGPSTRSSSAPGDLLGSLFLEAGASAVMLDANVGRSASNFWAGTSSHQFRSAADLIAADQAFAPDIVVVMLGTNDIGTNLINDQQAMQAIHDSFPQSDVWAIGPMTYVGPGATLNAGAQAVFDMMTGVFGSERTIDARPLAATTGRAGDGVHFGPTAAYQTALALAAAFATASGVSTTSTILWGVLGFGALLIGGVLLTKYISRRSTLKGLASGEIDLDDEEDDFGSDPFFAKIKRDRQARHERVRAAFTHSPAIIVKDKSGRETLLIKSGETANPEEGSIRISSFAHDGPIGHVTRKTETILIEEISDDFYPVDARPAFDDEVMEWTSTKEFERGAERVAAVQRANQRGSLKDLGARKPKKLAESQEMKELREAKERYMNALNYAGNTDEQVREYHKRLDEISDKMKALH